MKLHLGVDDVLYATPPKEYTAHRAKNGDAKGPVSTGDVAGFLENKYHVMQTFAEARENELAKAVENSMAGALENLMMGSPHTGNPLSSAEAVIAADFKKFLSSAAIEKLGVKGVPTAAALKGVNHRLKKGRNPGGARRPSFIDTGLYQATMRAWFEE